MTFTVDVHHHILPDFFWAATNEIDNPAGASSRLPGRRKAHCPSSTTPALMSLSRRSVHQG
jgi:6-methylsalicylate decarboxylase